MSDATIMELAAFSCIKIELGYWKTSHSWAIRILRSGLFFIYLCNLFTLLSELVFPFLPTGILSQYFPDRLSLQHPEIHGERMLIKYRRENQRCSKKKLNGYLGFSSSLLDLQSPSLGSFSFLQLLLNFSQFFFLSWQENIKVKKAT